MRDKVNRAQLAIGLIGPGPTWEQHYREPVRRLASKIGVRAVCDPVHARAASIANELRATAISSPWLLSQRHDIRAWLILDPGTFGVYPAALSVACGRPTLLANFFHSPMNLAFELFSSAVEKGETLAPAFPERFLPSTTRLRELIATRLGRVRQITLRIPTAPQLKCDRLAWFFDRRSTFAPLFDWCHCLVGTCARSVHVDATSEDPLIRLTFPARDDRDAECLATAEFVLRTSSDNNEVPIRRIQCERGSATITDPVRIRWETESDRADESLTTERSPFEIILDQFCRRALGGLVPIPTPLDALKCLELWKAACDSLATGENVSVKSATLG